MSHLIGLGRGLFSFIFVSIGIVVIMVLFGQILGDPARPDTTQLMIDPGSGRSTSLTRSEAQSLLAELQARVADLNTPVSDDPGLMAFTINPGEDALTVAHKLEASGLISDAKLFVNLLHYNGLDTRLQAGAYQLRRNMTMRQVGAALYRGRSARLTVTVPPGWRMEELAEYLTNARIMDGDWFLRQARQGSVVVHPLLADRPAGQSYEGYLFPGTYMLSDQATPAELIAQMLANLAAHLPANATSLAQQRGLTFYQVLTLASIVEREVVLAEERPVVAGVFLNRLKAGSAETRLQADPTVQYALGYQWGSAQWWKNPLELEDYSEVDSPYNTYLYPGLPPGPIASPGLDSIMAVLQPVESNYLFFVCRQPDCVDGRHVFAATYEEHLQNARNYWGQ